LFDYAYHSKKSHGELLNETPLLLVYEEAHKYVPKTELVKFNASRFAIERIAKEGRKYGITLAIVSQRPSEISETIFSQCSNFVANTPSWGSAVNWRVIRNAFADPDQ
jgi:DNA helicase HerA-like ATPase